MEITGEQRLSAAQDVVWAALNDPEMLRASIPGCEQLVATDANGYEAAVKARVGPVSARFTGTVELSDMVPPHSYRISGQGKGGVAGFASGGAEVMLTADGQDTILAYNAHAKFGGKLAQIGNRLIASTARKTAGQFFANFAENLVGYAPSRSGPSV